MSGHAADSSRFVSRGGLKLEAALEAFAIDVTGFTCADLGCSTGGYTDCLLQRGAAKVVAVDTGYGQLAWKLRQDERVRVMERTNALHAEPAATCDLVAIDLGWTKQEKVIPVALRWCRPGGHIVTLIKPHYESGRHRLDDTEAEAISRDVAATLPAMGVTVSGLIISPIRGAKGGNVEYLAWLRPTGAGSSTGEESAG